VWSIATGGVLKVAHAAHDLARRRLAREAEALDAIGRPAVPQLDGHGTLADGRAWIAMERIEGRSVAELTMNGPMRADHAVQLAIATLEALSRIHAAGFVHRDVKPDNLVQRPDGTIAILDLGLARKVPEDPDDPTRDNVQVGSLEYISPEQLAHAASVDVRSDLYSIGCLLYELCAGRPPFLGDAAALERAHMALRPPRLGAMAPVPLALEAICMDCLAKDPARRPRDAADLIARLQATRDTPSIARSVPTISQITESRQPVVLLWIELAKVDRAVLGILAAQRVLVLSQRGRRVLGALLGSVHVDPAGAAVALARDLATTGARVAVHLDALRVDGTTLEGHAVERPESWLPAVSWSGVILTRAVAAVAQVPTRPADAAGPAFRVLAEASDAPELFGRDALLTDLVADAAVALRGRPPGDQLRTGSGVWRPTGPAFALLIGDPGVGKSVVAAELARRIAELPAHVHLAQVPVPGSGKPPPLLGLIGDPPGPPVRAIGDALRAVATKGPVAVILDDLHHADHELLDALEYATLGGQPLPLWILGVASPRLDARRPQLGAGAERYHRAVLPPLDEDAAVELAAALLRPAEYPPMRAVRHLVSLAHRNPLHLTMLVREIHERGAIKKRPTGEYFLDTSALPQLEPIALGPWLAARETHALPAELVALARVCAVLGGPVTARELAAVVEYVEREGGPTTVIDPEVGLRELVAAGLLAIGPRGFVFRQPLVEEGLYATTPTSVRTTFHAAALAYWLAGQAGDPEVETRVARHAEAVGEQASAATAYAILGAMAETEHRTLDAEQAWSGALRHVPEPTRRRARALLGLARARMRLQRLHEARSALEEAVAIAHEVGDGALEIELLLEQGIVLDFLQDFAGVKAAVDRARARFAELRMPDAGLSIDLELATGRELFRAQRFAESAITLRRVLGAARATNRRETATIAALLLAPALAEIGELDAAEKVFEQVIAACTESGDRFHLTAAYGNRAWLWSARGAIERTADDLRVATQLARESGQAYYERGMTHNLAEQLLWCGRLDEALWLARRSLALQLRAGEGGTSIDRLLLARVLAAMGDLSELREVLATFDEEPLGDDDPAGLATLEVLRALAADAGADVWRAALDGTEPLFVQLRLELWHLAARAGRLPDELRFAAVELARTDSIWRTRPSAF